MLDTRVVSEPHVLIFEPFSLDVSRSELLRGDDVVQLRRQSFDVLRYLAQAGGRLVSNDEIVDAVWSVRPAQPNDSVTQCIKDIRRAMGDDARWMIRTVSGKGYEFKAPVRVAPSKSGPTVAEEPPAKAPSGEAEAITTNVDHRPPGSLRVASPNRWLDRVTPPYTRTAATVAAAVVCILLLTTLGLVWRNVLSANGDTLTMMAVPSIAVLQFSHATGGDEADLAQEIAAELMRVPRGFGIAIKSDTAKKSEGFDAKLTSSPVTTRYILSGNVRTDGATAHLNAHLIEANKGRQIWADTFEFLTSQPGSRTRASARVARHATDALLVAESRRPLPRDVKADHYAILGRAQLSGRGNAKINSDAMALFEKALTLDPLSVPALQGYARTKISAVSGGWVKREQRSFWLEQSERAISEIIKQRPRSYGAYRLRGSLLRARGEPEQAIKAFERALEFNSSYGSAYAEMGRTKIELGRAIEGLGDIRKALTFGETDPAAHSWLLWAGEAAAHAGDYSDALNWLQKAHEADPEQTNVVLWLAIARAGLGQMDAARAEMGRHLAKTSDYSLRIWSEAYPDRNPIVAEQRARLTRLLRQLHVPEGAVSSSQRRPNDSLGTVKSQ